MADSKHLKAKIEELRRVQDQVTFAKWAGSASLPLREAQLERTRKELHAMIDTVETAIVVWPPDPAVKLLGRKELAWIARMAYEQYWKDSGGFAENAEAWASSAYAVLAACGFEIKEDGPDH